MSHDIQQDYDHKDLELIIVELDNSAEKLRQQELKADYLHQKYAELLDKCEIILEQVKKIKSIS